MDLWAWSLNICRGHMHRLKVMFRLKVSVQTIATHATELDDSRLDGCS